MSTTIRSVLSEMASRKLMRFFVLAWSLTIMTVVYMWGMNYIDAIGFENVTEKHSIIIGVILGPITVLQGAIVKYFTMFGKD